MRRNNSLEGIILAIVAALIAGAGLRDALKASLEPELTTIIGTGGGILTSLLFSRLRCWLKPWSVVNIHGKQAGWRNTVAWLVGYVFFSPRYTRVTVLVLGALISTAATVLLNWASGSDVDAAIASGIAFLSSQLTHLPSKIAQPVGLFDEPAPSLDERSFPDPRVSLDEEWPPVPPPDQPA